MDTPMFPEHRYEDLSPRWKDVRVCLRGCILTLAYLALLTVGCGPVPAPKPPVPIPAATLAFDLVACKSPFVDNYCDGMPGAMFKVHVTPGPTGYVTFTGDANGYAWASGIPNIPDSDLVIDAPGYNEFAVHISPPILAATNAKGIHNVWEMTATHVDPSSIPLRAIAAVHGAMWPQGAPCGHGLPLGPRAGQPDNIIATDFFHNYSANDQRCILAWENEQHYTHVVVGPVVDSDGYHGIWTPTDWRQHWDEFLDIQQQFWDNVPADHSRTFGQVPVTFLHPDGWTFEQTRDALTPLLRQPRAQKLIRFVVPTGWEPTKYDWSSCTWAKFVTWAHQVLPNAVIAIHTVADVDAPVGTDALCDDNGKPNGEGWARVVAAGLHVWLVQNGAYTGSPAQDPNLAYNFGAQFSTGPDGAATHGAAWHFANGVAGWPTTSAWGNEPVHMINAEVTSYTAFWSHLPEASRTAWGDLAVKSGSYGYLDGGTIPVPVR